MNRLNVTSVARNVGRLEKSAPDLPLRQLTVFLLHGKKQETKKRHAKGDRRS
jgi:hypothetical protein